MVRFGDGLKTAADFQKLAAIRENSPLTLAPIVTIALNPAIDMKKAIIAYSIAVAPSRSGFSRCSAARIAKQSRTLRGAIMPGKG